VPRRGEGAPPANGEWQVASGSVAPWVSIGCAGDTPRRGPAATEGDERAGLAASSGGGEMCHPDTLKCSYNGDLALS